MQALRLSTSYTVPTMAVDVIQAYSDWGKLNINYRTHSEFINFEYNPYQIVRELIEEFYKDGFYLTVRINLDRKNQSIILMESESSNLMDISEVYIPEPILPSIDKYYQSNEEYYYKEYTITTSTFHDIGVILSNVMNDIYGLEWDVHLDQGNGYTVMKSREGEEYKLIYYKDLHKMFSYNFQMDSDYDIVARHIWLLLDEGLRDAWMNSFSVPKTYNGDRFLRLDVNHSVEQIGISDEGSGGNNLYNLKYLPYMQIYESRLPCQLITEIFLKSQLSEFVLNEYDLRNLLNEMRHTVWNDGKGDFEDKYINYPDKKSHMYSNLCEQFTNRLSIFDLNYLKENQ